MQNNNKKLNLLIIEGNTKEENINFNRAGCISQSENFSEHIKIHAPNSEIDIVEPCNDDECISKVISSLKKYNGIILTGSTLRVNETCKSVKKHIEFVKKCLEHGGYFFAACWGLQYHPEIPYSYMIKLLKHRKKKLLDAKSFQNENEIDKHIDLITREDQKTNDNSRTLELKNWLEYLEVKN